MAKPPVGTLSGEPPYAGTLFVSPNIITDSDRSSFLALTAVGSGERQMYDRRIKKFAMFEVYIFSASYKNSKNIEVFVNKEFKDSALVLILAKKYSRQVGRLPLATRGGIKYLWIHDGVELFGGGNESILIHVGQADVYEKAGLLEEALLHEACHTSLDQKTYSDIKWQQACKTDGLFISIYAKNNPSREDVAESFPLFWAVHMRPGRLPTEEVQKIKETIRSRIQYFSEAEKGLEP